MAWLNVKHVVIVILISWCTACAPFLVPALNTTKQVLGLPVTVWVAVVTFAIDLVINALAVKYAWDDFDDVDNTDETA